MKKWLDGFFSNTPRKRSLRKEAPLIAYFWDGGRPMEHTVQNISHSGFYLLTSERWLIGTLVMMTLQRKSIDSDLADCSVIALSKVVRHGDDGVGFEFVPVDSATPGQRPSPESRAANRKTLDHFLHLVSSGRN